MQGDRPPEFLVECFWPGVQETDLVMLDQRAATVAAELSGDGQPVRYLGSLLMPDDEVVLCRFEGADASVRDAAERAGIPFDRILKASRSPGWPGPPGPIRQTTDQDNEDYED